MLVVLYAPPEVHSLEISGIRDALFEANQHAVEATYDVRIIAEHPGPVSCASGLRIIPDATIESLTERPHTLVVAGAYGVPRKPSQGVMDWLRRQSLSASRYGAVCTGAFLLGAAGFLDGRHVTTHWEYAELLLQSFPAALVEPDRIFVRDGPLFTSAGVTSSIDLALALIEEDHGRDVALWVARRLVMFMKRPGGQSQFSVQLAAQQARRTPIQRVLSFVRDNPADDLSTPALASLSAMSTRNFSRLFKREAGMTAADFVELTRVDVARRMLVDSDPPLKQVALRSGFSGAEAMRRAFQRRLGLTASEYRQRFRSTSE